MRCEVPRSGDSLRFCGAVALRFGARRGRVGQRVVSASCRVEWMRLFFSTCGFVRYICRALVCFVCSDRVCDSIVSYMGIRLVCLSGRRPCMPLVGVLPHGLGSCHLFPFFLGLAIADAIRPMLLFSYLD